MVMYTWFEWGTGEMRWSVTRTCRDCGEEKSAGEFHRELSGLHETRYSVCFPCLERIDEIREDQRWHTRERWKEQKCRRCKDIKPASEFQKNELRESKLHHTCRPCRKEEPRGKRQKTYNNPKPLVDSKICSKCREEKTAAEFHRNKRQPTGLDMYCKECRRKR